MQRMFVIHYYINNQILDSYLHTKSEKIWLLFTFLLNWVFLRFPWQWQAFWNSQASKPLIHMPYNISIKFHPMPSTLNFSCFFVVSMATTAILKIPKVDCTSTHSPWHSCEVWISICSIKIYLEAKVHPNRRICVF